MADITSADVTYTYVQALTPQGYSDSIAGTPARRTNVVGVAFGDGALTYPAGGIPLTKVGLGMAAQIDLVRVIDTSDASDTAIWTYDRSANTLRGYSDATTELAGAVAASTIIVEAVGF